MRKRSFVIAITLLLGAVCARLSAQDKPAENPDVVAALRQYAAGDYAPAERYLQSISSLRVFQADLDRSAAGWLKGSTAVPASAARETLETAALDAAIDHLADPSAGKLIEWACKYVRQNAGADEFDRRWMRASMAALEGAMQPKLLAAHLEHVKARVPDDPHLGLARGLADEQRTAPWFARAGINAPDILPLARSAIAKYQDAATHDAVRGEAMLRIGYLQSRLHDDDAALAALADSEAHTHDAATLYLARLFRGQTLDRANKPADAIAAYRSALTVMPGASSAIMGLGALMTTQNQRAEASAAIDRLLTANPPASDPWWSYWPGDFRYIDSLLLQVREVIK